MSQTELFSGSKVASQVKSHGYADDLFGFPRLPDAVRESARYPIRGAQTEFVPEIDPGYVFRKELVQIMQFWITGVEKNLLLQGPTSSGKTTLVEQVAARLGWECYTVGCHGGLEFQELIGRVTLKPDGSTGWADGPLIAAMRNGGIFILDEMNFLKPEVAGGLNTVLQATAYLIPETGEVVVSHPDFRVAATGNALDGVGKGGYRGVQTPNIALMTRFTLGAKVTYLRTEDEILMLQNKAKGLDSRVANFIAEIASMSRKSYEEGALKAPMSPRETIATARRVSAFSSALKGDDAFQVQCDKLSFSLEMTMLFRWAPDDRLAFAQASRGVYQRLGLPGDLSI